LSNQLCQLSAALEMGKIRAAIERAKAELKFDSGDQCVTLFWQITGQEWITGCKRNLELVYGTDKGAVWTPIVSVNSPWWNWKIVERGSELIQ
jgi:hypothetical protein